LIRLALSKSFLKNYPNHLLRIKPKSFVQNTKSSPAMILTLTSRCWARKIRGRFSKEDSMPKKSEGVTEQIGPDELRALMQSAKVFAIGPIPRDHQGSYQPSPEEQLEAVRFAAAAELRLAKARASAGEAMFSLQSDELSARPTTVGRAERAAMTSMAPALPGFESIFHTERCRITYTEVFGGPNGYRTNVCTPDNRMTLRFGIEFDESMRTQGAFSISDSG
jgi:hypothetical protein